jgi:SulP family sulfate permease
LGTFRCDLIAGLTVAAVAVPQAMAYASIVGIPVQYGLYTAMIMTAVGALLDSSKQLIDGPTNAISIAVLSALASLPLMNGDERIAAAVFLALMVGAIQTAISLLRLGDLSRYISHSVIVGFTAGAAVLLVLDQIKNLLGLKAQGDAHDHFLKRWWLTISDGGTPDAWTVVLGLGTIVFVLLGGALNRRMRWRLPELLLAVIISAIIVWACGLAKERDAEGQVVRGSVEVVGAIPSALPKFSVPSSPWPYVRELADSALAIALLGLLEAIAMAKAIASRTRQRLDINQQCLSEGVANVAGSFFSCYPGSGSLTRSVINHQAGALTQWSGVISAVAVAATVVAFAPLARYIPRTALAGILIVSAFRMVDRHKFIYHIKVTRFDAVILFATAISAVALSVEFCILIGTFLSFLIYVPRAARVEITELRITPELMIRERKPGDPACDRLLLYNVEGELFFGAGPDLEQKLLQIEERLAEGIKVVVLRVKYARNLDGVCLDLLEHFFERLESRGVAVLLCGVRPNMIDVLRNVGWEERLGPQRIFPEAAALWSSTQDAVRRAYELLEDERCATCPNRRQDENKDAIRDFVT